MDTTQTSSSSPVAAASPAAPCCQAPAAPSLDVARTTALADQLKALADATRLRMLDLLAQQREPLCVCEITAEFAQRQPTISHHLRILREAGLVGGEKRGVWGYYWATEAGKHSLSIVKGLT